MQREPRHRVHQHGLAEGRAAARAPVQIDRRFHRHERQRHQFGDAAGSHLEIAQPHQMPRPMARTVDMAVHDRRRGLEADAVRRLDDVEPLLRVDLVGADDGADFVVKDFCGGAGQGAESGFLQPLQQGGDRNAERFRALVDFQRREGMDVHARHRVLDGAADRKIGLAGVVRVDAALQADFGGAARPGFRRAPLDFLQAEIVGFAAQIGGEFALGEGAELATEVADIGVVDVACDDVGHGVAVDARA